MLNLQEQFGIISICSHADTCRFCLCILSGFCDVLYCMNLIFGAIPWLKLFPFVMVRNWTSKISLDHSEVCSP